MPTGPIGPEQLGRWFDAHAGRLRLYARQWLDAPEADEAVQEAFLHLAGQRRAPGDARAWLFRAVRNACLNVLRSRRRRAGREQRAGAERTAWFAPAPEDLLDARIAQQALMRLDEPRREVVILRLWGQLGFRQIAEATHRAVSTVFGQYRSALADLRRIMETTSCKTPRN